MADDEDEDEGWGSLTGAPAKVPSRDDDEFLIFGKRPRHVSVMDAFVDEIFSDRMRYSNPLVGPLLREADTVGRYVWDLMAMAPPERRWAVRTRPFKDLLLAEVLLDESGKTAARHPKLAEELAELAEWIASQQWPQETERAAVSRVRARVRQGEARALRRDFTGAELRFGAAFAELHKLAVYEQSCFYSSLGSLREDQGRLDEAVSLQLHAMLLHGVTFQSRELPAGGIVQLAYLHLKRNDPWRAMTLLTQLLCAAKPDPFLDLYDLQIDLGRALCLAALGLAEPARTLIAQSLPRRRNIYDRDKQLPYEWLECRIAVHLGDFEPAIPRLEAIFRWLASSSGLAEACLCAIDLALAYEKSGQSARHFPGLLKEIQQLEGIADQPWALGSLWWFREAVDHGWDPARAAREAANIVHMRDRSLISLARRMRRAKSRKG
jgi:hypothetical protein